MVVFLYFHLFFCIEHGRSLPLRSSLLLQQNCVLQDLSSDCQVWRSKKEIVAWWWPFTNHRYIFRWNQYTSCVFLMFCLSECVRSFKKCHERQDIKTPRLFLFSWKKNANHSRRKQVVRVSGISNYCVRMCTYTVRVNESFSAGVSLYIFGEKISKNERCFPFFRSERNILRNYWNFFTK